MGMLGLLEFAGRREEDRGRRWRWRASLSRSC